MKYASGRGRLYFVLWPCLVLWPTLSCLVTLSCDLFLLCLLTLACFLVMWPCVVASSCDTCLLMLTCDLVLWPCRLVTLTCGLVFMTFATKPVSEGRLDDIPSMRWIFLEWRLYITHDVTYIHFLFLKFIFWLLGKISKFHCDILLQLVSFLSRKLL